QYPSLRAPMLASSSAWREGDAGTAPEASQHRVPAPQELRRREPELIGSQGRAPMRSFARDRSVVLPWTTQQRWHADSRVLIRRFSPSAHIARSARYAYATFERRRRGASHVERCDGLSVPRSGGSQSADLLR